MAIDLNLIKASDGAGEAVRAIVTSNRTTGSTVLAVDSLTNWPSKFIATAGSVLDDGTLDPATVTVFEGHTNVSEIIIDDFAPGYSDNGNTIGQAVVVKPTSHWADMLAILLGYLVPTGSIVPYAATSAPTGWLLADGSAVSRTTYADLYAIIGTTYGAGDSPTTFNLPDLRSRIPIGTGAGQWTSSFASSDVTVATDQITVTASPELVTGRRVQMTTTGALPTGISAATDYYIIVVDSTHIKLATSLVNAWRGTAVDITGQGTGTHTITQLLTNHTLGAHGGREDHIHKLSDNAAAQLSLIAGQGIRMRRISMDSWSDTHNISASVNASTQTVSTGAGLSGIADESSLLNPYLALNYIIKT